MSPTPASTRPRCAGLVLTLLFLLPLAGCEIPGLGPDPRIAQRDADARAIGGGCRYAMRGIEDCYNLNEKASKSQVFAGWKDMDQYMRDNKIEGIASQVAQASLKEAGSDVASTSDAEAGIDKVTEKLVAGARARRNGRAAPL